MNTSLATYTSGLQPFELPIIPSSIMRSIIMDATRRFKEEETLLKLKGAYIVVGDLHGHLIDLLRILQHFSPPPTTRYLFLGDMIDRGDFSLEVITLILILKVTWPDSVYIIRGNHEFDEICSVNGFLEDCTRVYPNKSIYQDFIKMFSYIPIAALHHSTLFLHGGIGPKLKRLENIAKIKRPINSFDDENVISIMWSDPSDNLDGFADSSRGCGQLFGIKKTEQFLSACRIEKIVRGHQCILDGIENSLNSKVTTVFSASNYCGSVGNKAGALRFDRDGFYTTHFFEPVPYITRQNCIYIECNDLLTHTSSKQNSSKIILKPGVKEKSMSLTAMETRKRSSNRNRKSRNLIRMPN